MKQQEEAELGTTQPQLVSCFGAYEYLINLSSIWKLKEIHEQNWTGCCWLIAALWRGSNVAVFGR